MSLSKAQIHANLVSVNKTLYTDLKIVYRSKKYLLKSFVVVVEQLKHRMSFTKAHQIVMDFNTTAKRA